MGGDDPADTAILATTEMALTPRSHRSWAAQMWCRMDRDRNGVLSRQELDCQEMRGIIKSVLLPAAGSLVTGAGAPYARAQINTDQAISFCLRKADLNNDGKVSFEEFESFTMTLRRVAGSVAKHSADLIFALFDLDGDHLINESEFREIYRFFVGHRPTEIVHREEWARLDPGAKGAVNRNEYARWLQTSTNPCFKMHAPPVGTMPMPGMPTHTPDYSGWDGTGATDKLSRTFSADSRERKAWLRGGLSAQFGVVDPVKMPRDSGMRGRPKWNNKLHCGYLHNPVEQKHRRMPEEKGPWGVRTSKDPPRCTPKPMKTYFQRHQSLPELERFLKTDKRSPISKGFKELHDHLCASGPVALVCDSLPGPRRHHGTTSDTKGHNDSDLPMLPMRHTDGGRMRCHWTGRKTPWDNHWVPAPDIKKLYHNGTNNLRCPPVSDASEYEDQYYNYDVPAARWTH